MNLAIDIGNTKSKYAFFAQNEMVESGIIEGLTEFGEFLTKRASQYERAIVCSVNHDEQSVATLFPADKPLLYLNHQTPVPMAKVLDVPMLPPPTGYAVDKLQSETSRRRVFELGSERLIRHPNRRCSLGFVLLVRHRISSQSHYRRNLSSRH